MSETKGDFDNVDERIKQLKVAGVEEDKNGYKAVVTLEAPLSKTKIIDLEEFFRMDEVKHLVIKEASKALNRPTGWSDMSRMFFFKSGQPVQMTDAADSVQVKFTCLAMP
jgi:hypothetical protein